MIRPVRAISRMIYVSVPKFVNVFAISTSAANNVNRPKVSKPNFRARMATNRIESPCAVRRDNNNAMEFCGIDLFLCTSLKCNKGKVAPKLERIARLKSIVQTAQEGEQTWALESEILICGWGSDDRQGSDR